MASVTGGGQYSAGGHYYRDPSGDIYKVKRNGNIGHKIRWRDGDNLFEEDDKNGRELDAQGGVRSADGKFYIDKEGKMYKIKRDGSLGRELRSERRQARIKNKQFDNTVKAKDGNEYRAVRKPGAAPNEDPFTYQKKDKNGNWVEIEHNEYMKKTNQFMTKRGKIKKMNGWRKTFNGGFFKALPDMFSEKEYVYDEEGKPVIGRDGLPITHRKISGKNMLKTALFIGGAILACTGFGTAIGTAICIGVFGTMGIHSWHQVNKAEKEAKEYAEANGIELTNEEIMQFAEQRSAARGMTIMSVIPGLKALGKGLGKGFVGAGKIRAVEPSIGKVKAFNTAMKNEFVQSKSTGFLFKEGKQARQARIDAKTEAKAYVEQGRKLQGEELTEHLKQITDESVLKKELKQKGISEEYRQAVEKRQKEVSQAKEAQKTVDKYVKQISKKGSDLEQISESISKDKTLTETQKTQLQNTIKVKKAIKTNENGAKGIGDIIDGSARGNEGALALLEDALKKDGSSAKTKAPVYEKLYEAQHEANPAKNPSYKPAIEMARESKLLSDVKKAKGQDGLAELKEMQNKPNLSENAKKAITKKRIDLAKDEMKKAETVEDFNRIKNENSDLLTNSEYKKFVQNERTKFDSEGNRTDGGNKVANGVKKGYNRLTGKTGKATTEANKLLKKSDLTVKEIEDFINDNKNSINTETLKKLYEKIDQLQEEARSTEGAPAPEAGAEGAPAPEAGAEGTPAPEAKPALEPKKHIEKINDCRNLNELDQLKPEENASAEVKEAFGKQQTKLVKKEINNAKNVADLKKIQTKYPELVKGDGELAVEFNEKIIGKLDKELNAKKNSPEKFQKLCEENKDLIQQTPKLKETVRKHQKGFDEKVSKQEKQLSELKKQQEEINNKVKNEREQISAKYQSKQEQLTTAKTEKAAAETQLEQAKEAFKNDEAWAEVATDNVTREKVQLGDGKEGMSVSEVTSRSESGKVTFEKIYDEKGDLVSTKNIVEQTYQDGKKGVTTCTYDPAGNIKTASFKRGNRTVTDVYENGRVKEKTVEYGEGNRHVIKFDENENVISQEHFIDGRKMENSVDIDPNENVYQVGTVPKEIDVPSQMKIDPQLKTAAEKLQHAENNLSNKNTNLTEAEQNAQAAKDALDKFNKTKGKDAESKGQTLQKQIDKLQEEINKNNENLKAVKEVTDNVTKVDNMPSTASKRYVFPKVATMAGIAGIVSTREIFTYDGLDNLLEDVKINIDNRVEVYNLGIETQAQELLNTDGVTAEQIQEFLETNGDYLSDSTIEELLDKIDELTNPEDPNGANNSDPSVIDNSDPSVIDNSDQSNINNNNPSNINNGDPSSINNGDPSSINNGDPSNINNGDPSNINNGDPSNITAGAAGGAAGAGISNTIAGGSDITTANSTGSIEVQAQRIIDKPDATVTQIDQFIKDNGGKISNETRERLEAKKAKLLAEQGAQQLISSKTTTEEEIKNFLEMNEDKISEETKAKLHAKIEEMQEMANRLTIRCQQARTLKEIEELEAKINDVGHFRGKNLLLRMLKNKKREYEAIQDGISENKPTFNITENITPETLANDVFSVLEQNKQKELSAFRDAVLKNDDVQKYDHRVKRQSDRVDNRNKNNKINESYNKQVEKKNNKGNTIW